MSLSNNLKLITGTAIGAGAGSVVGAIGASLPLAFAVTAPISYPAVGALAECCNNHFTDGDKSTIRAVGEGALKGLAHVPFAPVIGPMMAVSELLVTPVLGGAFGLWVASLTCEDSNISNKVSDFVNNQAMRHATEEAGEPAQSSEMGATQPV